MKLPFLRTCFAVLWMQFASHSALAQTVNKVTASEIPLVVSTQTQQLFAKYKDRLVQVRVLLKSAGEQTSLGSGFVVRDAGGGEAWLLTNYHVVSALAMEPSTYRMELRTHDNRTVAAQLMAIDVVHDLAVLRTQAAPGSRGGAWPSFALRSQKPKQGDKVYALGNPLELGFLISEGTYNGLVESRLYEQMLFSGALNSGMSGGPAIDATGQVVGVNVATRRDGQSLSFLVPIHYAMPLLNKAYQTQDAPTNWRGEITAHLLAHQQYLSNTLLGSTRTPTPTPQNQSPQTANPQGLAGLGEAPAVLAQELGALPKGFVLQTLDHRTVLSLHPSITKCWASAREGENLKYLRDHLSCKYQTHVYASNSLQTGAIELSYNLVRNQTLDAMQFVLSPRLQEGFASNFLVPSTKNITGTRCEDRMIQGLLHQYRLTSCVAAYKQFKGLYNMVLTAIQVDDPHERMQARLSMQGLAFDNAMRLARVWTEHLQ